MLRFALFSTPDEGPPLFKDHICVNHRVVSQEGDYCNSLACIDTSLFMQVRKVLSAAKDGVEEGHAPSE